MKQETKVVGNDFTQQEHEAVRYSEHELHAWSDEVNKAWEDPWASRRENVQWAEAMLAEEGRKPKHSWKPYDDVEWYLWKLVCHGQDVESHIERGEAASAAHKACLYGEIWRELFLMLDRGELYLAGLKQRTNRDEGIKAWRKGDQAERVREIDARGPDVPKTQVFRRIAKRENVTFSAIKTDYYLAKKKASKPHD